MRALQALVAFLGVLIFVGLGLVVLAMTQGPKSGAPAPIPATAMATSRFALPAGYHVAEMVATADRVVLRLDSVDGRQQLIILDPATGLVTRTLSATGAP